MRPAIQVRALNLRRAFGRITCAGRGVRRGETRGLSAKPRFGGPGLKRKRCSAPIEGEEAIEEAGAEAAEVVRLHLEGQPTLCVGW